MSRTVDQIIDQIISNEGGYVNDPDDKGGPTKYGITHKTLAKWRHVPHVTPDQVQALTEEEARKIYRNMYYGEPRMDLLPDDLEPVVVDFGVMVDPWDAIRVLQRILAEHDQRVVIDGLLGPKTLAAIQKVTETDGVNSIINAYVDARIEWHRSVAAKRPKQKKFLKGWINRANEFRVDEPIPADKKVLPHEEPVTQVAEDTKKVAVGAVITAILTYGPDFIEKLGAAGPFVTVPVIIGAIILGGMYLRKKGVV